jgi:hypothetical protein
MTYGYALLGASFLMLKKSQGLALLMSLTGVGIIFYEITNKTLPQAGTTSIAAGVRG